MISKANAVHFYLYDPTGLQTFDNRCPSIETHYQTISLESLNHQRVGGDLVIQVMITAGNSVSMTGQSGDGLTITPVKIRTAGGYDFYEFTVTSTIATTTYLTVIEKNPSLVVLETYKSSTIEFINLEEVKMNEEGYLKLQWFSADNSFMCDYSNDIVHECWVFGELMDYEPKIEDTIFDNDEETKKLKEIVKRTLLLKLDPLSRQQAEIICVGLAHDRFYINEVEYVKTEAVSTVKMGNLSSVNVPVVQSSVIGLNTHDTSFTQSTDEIMIVKLENKTATFATDPLSNLYYIDFIHVYKNAGSSADATIKIGTTLAGDEIMLERGFTSGDRRSIRTSLRVEQLTGGILYFTIGGTSPDISIFITLIKNED